MQVIRCILAASFFPAFLFPQALGPRLEFTAYPVKRIYKGKPASPILSKEQRWFRTMIRRGADGPVEFAGHYTVPRWGCGTDCNQFAVVDSITGKVYLGPFSVNELPLKRKEQKGNSALARMEFHDDSRLMKINACANEKDCGFYDFVVVEGEGLKLIRKELLPSEYQ